MVKCWSTNNYFLKSLHLHNIFKLPKIGLALQIEGCLRVHVLVHYYIIFILLWEM